MIQQAGTTLASDIFPVCTCQDKEKTAAYLEQTAEARSPPIHHQTECGGTTTTGDANNPEDTTSSFFVGILCKNSRPYKDPGVSSKE
jgi:hypothetical protein